MQRQALEARPAGARGGGPAPLRGSGLHTDCVCYEGQRGGKLSLSIFDSVLFLILILSFR